ncbi:MAG TPA: diguanylate cyclase [Thermoleophilaceae bacterium]|nr:diguanylate cyclase [Thermoleophilaceae bacterium]
MSFRSRLRVFFAIIVVVPMAAVALVLFSITADSETGKVDARLAEGLRTAFAVYDDRVESASRDLRGVTRDDALQDALESGSPAALRSQLRRLARTNRIDELTVYDASGRLVARAGSRDSIAHASAAPTTADGRRIGTVSLSTTRARAYVSEVARLTGLDVRVFRGGERLATTLQADEGPPRSGSVVLGGREYRGRFQTVAASVGPAIQIGLFEDADELESSIGKSRLLIGAILLAFLVLALASSVFVVRALQGQVAQFLTAAKRVGGGDFSTQVPVEGRDEFASLGAEFNSMSLQLAAQIDEVERKRRQLEEAIRRVGDAFATGLDREGIVELVVRTSMDACAAQAGRAVPIDPQKMPPAAFGSPAARLRAGLEAAERHAFTADRTMGAELLAQLEPSIGAPKERRLSEAEVDGVHALALPLRANVGAGRDPEHVGVVSIARDGSRFSEGERELFAYLAGQAIVSIENADLHETVQRQAITDELTSLYNVRHFHEWLDAEVERSRRFGTDIGLVMMDIDDFKQVNDTYGHQQGDVVLREIALILRQYSRDIDEPARYGGEEMALVLPQTDLDGTELAASRIRHAIEALEIPRVDGKGAISVTASFGVAAIPGTASDKSSLIAAADAALYRAKRAGKNRVERAEPMTAPS